ncbi:hypothetical protein NFJ02_14g16760 [Pycnococcus provasolii]
MIEAMLKERGEEQWTRRGARLWREAAPSALMRARMRSLGRAATRERATDACLRTLRTTGGGVPYAECKWKRSNAADSREINVR